MLKDCFGHFKTASVLTTHSMNEAEMLSNKIGIMVYLLLFKKLHNKTVGFSHIQTQNVKVEGGHADHLTTITANDLVLFVHHNLL